MYSKLARSIGAVTLAMGWLAGCGSSADDLPPVWKGRDETCGGDSWAASAQYPFLVPGSDGLGEPCISEVFPNGGEVEFDVVIDAWGFVKRVDLPATLSPSVAACARKVAADFVFIPAHTCDGTPVPSHYPTGFGLIVGADTGVRRPTTSIWAPPVK